MQGDSEKQVLRAFTLKSAERQVDQPEAKLGGTGSSPGRSGRVMPVLWVVVAIASILVLITLVLVLVIRTRCFTGGPG